MTKMLEIYFFKDFLTIVFQYNFFSKEFCIQLFWIAGFKLVKQNQCAKICERNKEKATPKRVLGFVNHFMNVLTYFY